MRVLLDTHVLIWWFENPARISRPAFRVMEDPGSDLVWSVIGTVEMALKVPLGRLRLPGTLDSFLEEQREQLGLEILPVEQRHALRLATLPPHHRDPFDRLLVAQAMAEGIPVVSSDPRFRAYDVEVLW
jgi:PIN domain nuclease of toxin-antitoxin system